LKTKRLGKSEQSSKMWISCGKVVVKKQEKTYTLGEHA
jgi:hypothetical protein